MQADKADDARQLRWVFLIPDAEFNPTTLASCFEVEGWASQEDDRKVWSDFRAWDNVRLTPASLQSEFCILHSDEQRNRPILEGLAREVLTSIEGLAEEEVNLERSSSNSHKRLFIFPAIVTNAEIVVCRFDPSKISLFDGTFEAENVEMNTVPFVRFRKSLATEFPQGNFYRLAQANKARERTVFVVNAESIQEFLTGWDLNPQGHRYEYAVQRLIRSRDHQL